MTKQTVSVAGQAVQVHTSCSFADMSAARRKHWLITALAAEEAEVSRLLEAIINIERQRLKGSQHV